jgi:hypothetical protein
MEARSHISATHHSYDAAAITTTGEFLNDPKDKDVTD